MPNSIAKFKSYIALLDEVYKHSACSTVLDSDSSLIQQGANANEIVIPKISMDGLADYSRNSGYVQGDVTLTMETVQYDYDRGRSFAVDAMDNEETAGVAFGRLASEFIRTKTVPELDAYRFAKYAGTSGISKVASGATLSSGADVLGALITAQIALDEDEVPSEERYLFITPSLLNLARNVDLTKSKAVLDDFAAVIKVPQSRFYTAIDLADGYIHLSAGPQAQETARKYFSGRGDLVLLTVEADALGEALKWEPSRGGDLFPHLYAALDVGQVLAARPLELDAEGVPVLGALA